MPRPNLRTREEPQGAIQRLLRIEAGEPDVFGSERSFNPPIGERWQADLPRRGYYIDFRIKTEKPIWPPAWLPPPRRQLHVAIVQWALGAYERFAAGEGDEWLNAALGAAEHLIDIQIDEGSQKGGFAQLFEMPHTYSLHPPWLSAITQGEAASLFARLHAQTEDQRFKQAALDSLLAMEVPVADGGLYAELEGGPFAEEYPSSPASYVLNGAIFAQWGFLDAGEILGDEDAARTFAALSATLADALDRFDNGWWSLYDLYPHPVPNIASPAYHGLHIKQLQIMGAVTGDERFTAMSERFDGYRASRLSRTRSFAEKVAFRLTVPRNPAVARTLPWSPLSKNETASGRAEDVLVLCYHALSTDWDAALAISPDAFDEQMEHLRTLGYESVSFTDAVCGAVSGKVVAITFDDSYRSVSTLAKPILDRYGYFGTVFVPTDFVGSEKPMVWEGIEHFASGPHAAELIPMSWDELRALKDGGWEIGSHTCSHPPLTRQGPERIERELRDSRTAIADALGAPCTSIAYPSGDVDEEVRQAAAREGFFAGAALTDEDSEDSVFGWPRVGIYNVDGPKAFRVKVSPRGRQLRRSKAWKPLALALHPFRRHEPAIS